MSEGGLCSNIRRAEGASFVQVLHSGNLAVFVTLDKLYSFSPILVFFFFF